MSNILLKTRLIPQKKTGSISAGKSGHYTIRDSVTSMMNGHWGESILFGCSSLTSEVNPNWVYFHWGRGRFLGIIRMIWNLLLGENKKVGCIFR